MSTPTGPAAVHDTAWTATPLAENYWQVHHGQRAWTAHQANDGSWHITNEKLRPVAKDGRLAKNIIGAIISATTSSKTPATSSAGRPRAYDDADTAEWTKLLNDGWTYRKVADHYGVNPSTIRRRVGPINRRPGPAAQPITAEQVADSYARTHSLRATAAELGITVSAVRRRLATTR